MIDGKRYEKVELSPAASCSLLRHPARVSSVLDMAGSEDQNETTRMCGLAWATDMMIAQCSHLSIVIFVFVMTTYSHNGVLYIFD